MQNGLVRFFEIALIATVVFLNGWLIQTPLPDDWGTSELDKYSQAVGDVAFLDAYLKRNPNSWEACFARAQAYAINGIWSEVASNCDSAISLRSVMSGNKPEPKIYRLRLKALYELDDNQAALKDLDFLMQSENAKSEDLAFHSLIKRRLGQTDQALDEANQAIFRDAKCAEAYLSKAWVLLDLNRTKDAFENAYQACKLKPNLVMPYVIMAAVFNEKGETAEALVQCKNGLLCDATCGAVYWQRGVAEDKQQKFEDALTSQNMALSLATSNDIRAQAFAARAVTLSHLNRSELASEDCDRALALDPGNAIAKAVKQQLRQDN